jgi:CAAX prenyl protease-like protein
MTEPLPLDYQSPPSGNTRISDDLAYILPMGIFLAFTWAAGQWPATYAICYVLKTIATAIALIVLWRRYTIIRWNAIGLGILIGIVGTFQWIGMQLLLQKHFAFFHPSPDAFNPLTHFTNRAEMIAFIAVRLSGAVLVVPVMEELFWRDYLWRQILSPNDFKLAAVGEWAVAPLLIVSGVFATVHGNWWLTAIVWAMMIGGLLVYTKSLGACIVAHAVTNLLLGIYVLVYHDWAFW